MKSAYKKISSHGAINIPVAMRREIGLMPGDAMEVSQEGGGVMIKPYIQRCIFCGTTEKVLKLDGKGICPDCAEKAQLMIKGGIE